jgi:hypothetical protein
VKAAALSAHFEECIMANGEVAASSTLTTLAAAIG